MFLIRGVYPFLKAFFGNPMLFLRPFKGFLSFLLKAFLKGFLSFFKGLFKGFLSFLLKAFFN